MPNRSIAEHDSTMRFRPASINYLADASSYHTINTPLTNLVVQRIQEVDRRDEEEDAKDTEEEEVFELRSVHSGDSDDFHHYCDDGGGPISDDLVRHVLHFLLDFSGESNKALPSTTTVHHLASLR